MKVIYRRTEPEDIPQIIASRPADRTADKARTDAGQAAKPPTPTTGPVNNGGNYAEIRLLSTSAASGSSRSARHARPVRDLLTRCSMVTIRTIITTAT